MGGWGFTPLVIPLNATLVPTVALRSMTTITKSLKGGGVRPDTSAPPVARSVW